MRLNGRIMNGFRMAAQAIGRPAAPAAPALPAGWSRSNPPAFGYDVGLFEPRGGG